MIKEPSVVISLDFELRWGVHDVLGLDINRYKGNLVNARELVVPQLLQLFSTRDIRVTWAVVGALACHNWDEYFERAPTPILYTDPALAITPQYADLDPSGCLHFCPELISLIDRTPGQEIGTHTFSHIYMQEPGITQQDVQADLEAVFSLWRERFHYQPISLVFPRNQVNFIPLLKKLGIKIWRGNPPTWYYNCWNEKQNALLPRALRMIDSVNSFKRCSYPAIETMTSSSQFLRVDLPDNLWMLHFNRIRTDIRKLRPGQTFHLWWHPHNLGADTQKRLKRVEAVVELIANAQARGLLSSCCMADLIKTEPQERQASVTIAS